MIIDTHAHILPQATLEAMSARTSEFPSVVLIRKDENSPALYVLMPMRV